MLRSSIQHLPLVRTLLDFAFPPLCPGCGDYVEDDQIICGACRGKFDVYDFPFCIRCRLQVGVWPKCPSCSDALLPLFAYGNYEDPLKQVIAEMKFHGVLDSVPIITKELVETFADRIASRQPDCLVPIPLHPSREYDRGYNQSLHIAEAVGAELDLPVRTDLIARTARRHPQQTLPAAKRATNIRGVFEACDDGPERMRILLVDDVVTSGETVLEASRVLDSVGHRTVGVIALAHGM